MLCCYILIVSTFIAVVLQVYYYYKYIFIRLNVIILHTRDVDKDCCVTDLDLLSR